MKYKRTLGMVLIAGLFFPTSIYGNFLSTILIPQAWGDGSHGSAYDNFAKSLSKSSSAKNLTLYLDPESSAFKSPSSWQKHLVDKAFSSPLKVHNPVHVKRHLLPTEIVPFASSGQSFGTSPPQVWNAYGLNSINCSMTGYQWGDSHLCGYGQVIGIVDWYYDANIENDLGTFSQYYGLPSCTTANGCLNILVENGAPTNPKVPDNMPTDLEISLDVEWAHAIAPGAAILLVNPASNSIYDILGGNGFLGGVNLASQSPGVHQGSMSFGGTEFSGENSFDNTFQVSGVSFFGASGDSGIGTIYPAASPYVVSVGGTILNFDNTGNLQSETAWSGSGGGYSTHESQPQYQINYGISSGNMRAQPDVAASATNFPIYDSVALNGGSGWYTVYGTSASTPLWASFIGIANSEHSNPLSSTSFGTMNAVYNAAIGSQYGINFRDITSGNNGNCAICNAKPGYDFVTGLGSPIPYTLNPFLSPQALAAPGQPIGLAANAISSSRINLSWTAPASNGGPAIIGYKIERSTDGGTIWNTVVANTASTTTSYSNYFLSASTTYTYRLSAINAIGISLPSSNAFATTSPATVPDSPRYINRTVVTPSRINLSWWTPVNTGGSAITGYQIERSTDGGTTWNTIVANTGSALYINHYSNYFLSANTTYTYRVSAINAIGTSLPSSTASATTSPATVPDPPRYLSATTVSPSQINLSWWTPVNTGGSAITGYKIKRSTDGGTTWNTIVANTGSVLYINHYSNTGLLPSATYTYRVSAINAIGTSAPSSSASATTSPATTQASISLSPTSGNAGTTVTVIGSNFTANSGITISYDGTAVATTPGTITTSSSGGFSAAFTVPTSAAGSHTVNAKDAASNSASAQFTVTTSTTSTLGVKTQDKNGNTITGFYVSLSQRGTVVASGFSPVNFTVNNC